MKGKKAMNKCKYCSQEAKVNEEALCPRCASIAMKARSKLMGRRLLPPPDTRFDLVLERPGTGSACAVCDESINETHKAYLKQDPEHARPQWDLHVHTLCRVIWEGEGTVARQETRGH